MSHRWFGSRLLSVRGLFPKINGSIIEQAGNTPALGDPGYQSRSVRQAEGWALMLGLPVLTFAARGVKHDTHDKNMCVTRSSITTAMVRKR